MITFEKIFLIDRPQQEVFDFSSDPANDTKWQGSTDLSEWTSPAPIGVGSTQRSVVRFLGRKIESTLEVTAWDPPNQYALKTVSGPVPFEINVKLASQGNGTQVTLSGQGEFGGFFKLAEGLVGKQLENQLDKDFKKLKQVLESGG